MLPRGESGPTLAAFAQVDPDAVGQGEQRFVWRNDDSVPAGLRNLIAHPYGVLNVHRVFEIASNEPVDLCYCPKRVPGERVRRRRR